MEARLKGVFSAVATPVAEDWSVDNGRFIQHCRQLLDDGCHGLAVLGSTGEANSIGLDARRRCLDALVAGGIAPDRLMPGTGMCASAASVALCRHALSLGVTKVVVLPPFYYKGPDERGLLDFYSRVIEGVGDARLRLVLYHIPQISTVPITRPIIEGLHQRFTAIVAGIKDSAGDLDHMSGLARDYPWLSVFAGADPLMLPLLRVGGAGCITATSNLVAGALRTVYDGYADKAKAAEVDRAQARINAFRTLSNSYVQIPTVKAMVAARYRDNAWLRVWPPFVALGESEAAAVAQGIADIEAAA